jgi:hypothetical protein
MDGLSDIGSPLLFSPRAEDQGLSTGKSTVRRKRKVGAASCHHLAKKVNAALTRRPTRHIQRQEESGNQLSPYCPQLCLPLQINGGIFFETKRQKCFVPYKSSGGSQSHLATSPSASPMTPYSAAFLWKKEISTVSVYKFLADLDTFSDLCCGSLSGSIGEGLTDSLLAALVLSVKSWFLGSHLSLVT